eukprot:TRINITY_DN1722_c0_g1_i1.p1 TRINITY_DN1722_c0_g1~~TRINITY_DN1722_c0_g1_i1.p1  ORF type:complete len:106 (+),score=11.42 TRINITY_DN1722_c0_g1_i1:57-374(+)
MSRHFKEIEIILENYENYITSFVVSKGCSIYDVITVLLIGKSVNCSRYQWDNDVPKYEEILDPYEHTYYSICKFDDKDYIYSLNTLLFSLKEVIIGITLLFLFSS